jgi:hypothetical protein
MTAPVNDGAKDRSGSVKSCVSINSRHILCTRSTAWNHALCALGVAVSVGDAFMRYLDPQRLDVLHERMRGKAGCKGHFARLALLGPDDFERPTEKARRQIPRGKGKPWGMKRPFRSKRKLLAARPAATICSPAVRRRVHWPAPTCRPETAALGGVLDGGHKAVEILLGPKRSAISITVERSAPWFSARSLR